MRQLQLTLTTALLFNLLAIQFGSAVHAETLFFRVVNESGTVELKSHLSPEEAKRGYSIVTLGGHVVETVAPELTAEQIAAQSAAEQEKQAQLKQQAYDEALMLRFASMQDLEIEQRRKLGDFDIRISILRSNLSAHKDKLAFHQQRAASIERKGRTVPESTSQRINELETKIQETNAAIQQRLDEKTQVAEQYEKDGQRLSQLLEQPN